MSVSEQKAQLPFVNPGGYKTCINIDRAGEQPANKKKRADHHA
jgi:hypothetical protein